MIKGITYYKLKSDYEGAIPPKDCGLKGEEIDNNFYVLEGRDVKSVTVEDDRIVITLVNGDTISSEDVFSGFVKDLYFDFNSETGTLYITQNGQTTEISGFGANEDCCFKGVYTDSTLVGNGTIGDPLSISPMYRPGKYAPVIGFIDKANGEQLPDTTDLAIGTRYVISDYINDYGMLYCYDGVKQICCELKHSNSEWRIPKKEDWDDMLNAIEPFESDRNHNMPQCHKWLGKYAGKYLKTGEFWKEYEADDEETGDEGEGNQHPCGNCCQNEDPCAPHYCGEFGHCCEEAPEVITPTGIDKYGFGAKPAGYGLTNAGEGIGFHGFGAIARFWTATNTCEHAAAYIKELDYDRSEVYQDIVPSNHYNSLRLVKDYNGSNYYGVEHILNHDYDTVIMPSVEKGSRIWTAVNFMETGEHLCAVEPNDGVGVTRTLVYYIIEWDGTKWVTVRLYEGYSVTIVENGNVTEYHVVINPETGAAELVPISVSISVDIMTIIQPLIDDITERLNQEISDRIDGDANLSSAITEETQEREEADENLQSQIDTLGGFVAENAQNITTLTERVDGIEESVEEIQTNITNIQSDITNIQGDIVTINNIIGEYNTVMGTIEERLSKIENLLQNGLIDFNDRNADEIDNDEIIVDGQPW